MVYFQGLTISVVVDGQALPEYSDEEPEDVRPNSMNSYIESQAGREFAIRFTWDRFLFNGCVGITCDVLVDGVSVSWPVILLNWTQPYLCAGPQEAIDGKWTVRPMIFEDLQTSEVTSMGIEQMLISC